MVDNKLNYDWTHKAAVINYKHDISSIISTKIDRYTDISPTNVQNKTKLRVVEYTQEMSAGVLQSIGPPYPWLRI